MNEIDDVLCRCAGQEDLRDSSLLERRNVGFGDDASDEHGHIIHAFVVKQLHQLRADGVVRAGKDGKTDDVDVFLHGSGCNHFGRLPQPV